MIHHQRKYERIVSIRDDGNWSDSYTLKGYVPEGVLHDTEQRILLEIEQLKKKGFDEHCSCYIADLILKR